MATLTDFAAAIREDVRDGVLNDSVKLKKMALQIEAMFPDSKDLVDKMISVSNKAAELDPPISDLLMTVSKDIRTFMLTGSDFEFDVRTKSDGTINISPRNGYMKDGIIHSFTGGRGYPEEIVFANRLSQIRTMDELRSFLAKEGSPQIASNFHAQEIADISSYDGPMMMM